jgi:acyl-coenzyme A thioesterase PaaI-like protein
MKVLKKQTNSYMCFICGIHNDSGLKTNFYEMEDNTLVAIVKGKDIHQSYPNRMHGGVISALIDESVGRAIWIEEPETWGVTMDLQMKYRKPVPLNEDLMVVSKITKNTRRVFEGTGYLINKEQQVLAEGNARYIKLSLNDIDNNTHEESDINVLVEDDVKEIDITVDFFNK